MKDVSCENPSDFKLFSPDANAAFISLASVFCAALKKYAYKSGRPFLTLPILANIKLNIFLKSARYSLWGCCGAGER